MRSIIFDFEDNNSQNLYIQIFDQIKARILSGEFEAGMKLPSLRGLAKANDISVTTVETAYNQLLVEGYIESRPKSGYYVSDDISGAVGAGEAGMSSRWMNCCRRRAARLPRRDRSYMMRRALSSPSGRSA